MDDIRFWNFDVKVIYLGLAPCQKLACDKVCVCSIGTTDSKLSCHNRVFQKCVGSEHMLVTHFEGSVILFCLLELSKDKTTFKILY